MLDNETKRRIDSARDILVGKVPDPKSQVEQITIALIYKFMDDMDKEAIEFGGKASFFTGEYEKYGWSKIFDPRLGGYEMLSLYGEAIEKLDQNPNIPQLFRDIFKNAYLPYRDPETLKLFLKTINEFHYDHSEKLGDAFEYLLSVLGSQGDAGQFRTPRHIIDFIVNLLQPKKNETILDPACGTAGFLISSYKHILKNNSIPGGEGRGGTLTPNDRKKLMDHFTGYDISPDMVRLSLVNMYLHHFTSPRIYEYDTLTSEDRWGDYFDIIMANPPFMSPTGGIKPHKRFTIQAKRSEALFVDYIAEHINPTTGRAGVIVPEGVIFKNETAFKSLRKLLVDKDYLYTVVSLPAGIFNPYSGVKTSVLLMDKTIAKKTDKILFVKIENDGFDLGAQRKAITKNDLTDALEVINDYQLKIKNDEAVEELSGNYLLVEKEKIKGNIDYNLSIDRYSVNESLRHSIYEKIKLGDVCEVISGQSPESEFYNEVGSGMPFYQGRTEFTDMYIGEPKTWTTKITRTAIKDDILMSVRAPVGPVNISTQEICIGRGIAAIRPSEKIQRDFLFYFLRSIEDNIKGNGGAVFDSINRNQIMDLKIPLPPPSIQQEIVNKIEGWQKIIDGAKQIIENYKPQIDIDPDWEMVKLGEVCDKIQIGPFGTQLHQEDYKPTGIPIINPKHIINSRIFPKERISKEKADSLSQYYLKNGDVIMARRGEMGRVAFIDKEQDGWFCGTGSLFIRLKHGYNGKLYALFFSSIETINYLEKASRGVTMANLNLEIIENLPIPDIPLSIQQQIVNRIEQEQQLINANKQLIQIFEQKIKDEINKLWQTEVSDTSNVSDTYVQNDLVTMAAEE